MIRFQQIAKQYGQTYALREVNFEVPEGAVCCLLGPSGCGKTTLLRLVNRLIEPSSGQIFLNGKDVQALEPTELRRGMGYAIQSTGLFPHMSVLENVVVVPRLLGWDKAKREKRAGEMLALVGLEPAAFARRYPRELSGGQAQRVGLARALCADPPVLLMDEPFGAVDPPTRDKLQEEFLKLQAKLKKTVLFVTHDLEEAVRLGDQICLMNMGQVEQYGTPDELLKNPSTAFVHDFLGPSRTLLRLSRIPLASLVEPLTGPLPQTSIAQQATAREAFSALLAGGGNVLGVKSPEGELVGVVRLESLLAQVSDH